MVASTGTLTFGWFHARPSVSVLPGNPRSFEEQVAVKAEPRAGGLSPVPGLPTSVSMSLLEPKEAKAEERP